MTIIQCYAPPNEEEEEDIEKFYEKLQQTWNNTPKKDIRIATLLVRVPLTKAEK